MKYGEVLAYYIEKQGVSAAELARRIGSPRSTVHGLLSGRAKSPTLDTAVAIADALEVPLKDMIKMMEM